MVPVRSREASAEDLVAAARAGDRAALEQLLARYQGHIWRFGLKMCGHPHDAEEVLQETMLAVARSIRSFRGEASLSTWLFKIARSFCIKQRRRHKAPEAGDDGEQPRDGEGLGSDALAAGSDPEEALASRQLERALQQAIAHLPAKYREVFLLRDVEGLSAQETAEILGLQVATVKTRLHRARAQVRALLAPWLGEEEPAPAATCPEIARVFSRHLEGELSPQLCAEMERHLAACPRCRSTCDALKRMLAVCRKLPTPEVPESLQRSIAAAIRQAA